ncbi:MAG: hypothetical protein ABMA13_00675 [Chthoniobacteraceae bacterium]
MIRVEPISDDEWLVTVEATTTTKHRVRVTPTDLHKFGGGEVTVEQLLEASFRFLLERESNCSILSSFDLPVISTYFPEYEKQICGYITRR